MPKICSYQFMLRVNNLTKYFGNQLILDNISFTVEDGEIVALVGVFSFCRGIGRVALGSYDTIAKHY